MSIKKYFGFQALLRQSGWMSPAFVGIDDHYNIQYLSESAPDGVAIEYVAGIALPGFRNAHAHAFQFGMAGMAEQHQPGTKDDFWSWREAMYQCALRLDPSEVEAIAAMLYAELLKKGYTHVAEFHYLHHDKNGKPYNNLAEMGERLVAAAETAGIKITLIPVFYQQGNFGTDPFPEQRRFISKTIDDYFHLLDVSANAVRHGTNARLGFGVHSLRAVKANDVVNTLVLGPKNIPFHLHAAEQKKEVQDCLSFHGTTPISWLIDHLPVDSRFNIVHCTHLTDHEVVSLAKSGAHVVLCPGTEGNLGDGIFRLTGFSAHNGKWAIGTDSHISLNPLEDLRWLDYAQRLTTHKRNTFDDGAAVLVNKVFQSGNAAMGIDQPDYFEKGQPLDAVVYDVHRPLIMQAKLDQLLPVIVYTASAAEVLGTIVDGKWIVKNNYHIREGEIMKAFSSMFR